MPPASPLFPEISACLAAPVLLQNETAGLAIEETMQGLRGHPHVQDLSLLIQQVLNREHRASTATDSGVAFPHARTSAVTAPVLALGISETGVRFDDGNIAHLLLIVAVPPDQPRAYLDLIAHLVRKAGQHSMQNLIRIRTISDLKDRLAL